MTAYNSGLHTSMRDKPSDDELVNAVFFELQIQIGVGETAGTPMLRDHDVGGAGFEFWPDLTAPCAEFEGLSIPGCLLDWRHILPCFVVAGAISPMERIEHSDSRPPSSVENLHHVGNTLVRFGDALQTVPHLAALGDQIVVGIDDDKCGDLLFVCQLCLFFSPMLRFTTSMRVMRKDQVAIFGQRVARKAALVHRLTIRLAVGELSEPPAASRGVFCRVLDHELNIGCVSSHQRFRQ